MERVFCYLLKKEDEGEKKAKTKTQQKRKKEATCSLSNNITNNKIH